MHLHYEGYNSVYLPADDGFKVVRMCPPEKINFFFTAENIQTPADNLLKSNPKQQALKVFKFNFLML